MLALVAKCVVLVNVHGDHGVAASHECVRVQGEGCAVLHARCHAGEKDVCTSWNASAVLGVQSRHGRGQSVG
jgi:hypothetical protein